MFKGRGELRVSRSAGGDPAQDVRRELLEFKRRPVGRGPILAAGALAAVVAVNLGWVLGSVQPRLKGLQEEVDVARAAERSAMQEAALLAAEVDGLRQVLDQSARYRIPADLAQRIHEIALSEDLEPDLAFRLVQTESSFRRHAVSEAGAIGYTQILQSTARWLDPRVEEKDLFDRDTNLRLGFRYLRLLLEENGGEMRLALLAYNRGPGTVRAIIARGGDPANGYASRVMGSE